MPGYPYPQHFMWLSLSLPLNPNLNIIISVRPSQTIQYKLLSPIIVLSDRNLILLIYWSQTDLILLTF